MISRKRKRPRHAWQHTIPKSSMFAYNLQENVSTGYRTQQEYFLIASIIRFLTTRTIEYDTKIIHSFYSACIEMIKAYDLHSIPIGEKSENQVDTIIKEYHKNMDLFAHICVEHLKINSKLFVV